jgi:SAM-dependent methyltransferase
VTAAATHPASREAAVRAALAANHRWYHTLELAPGTLTPGHIDLRATAQRVLPAPGDLRGARALDVGTYDGFWAFELERRGASEVLALDLPSPEASQWPVRSRERLIAQAREWDVELGRGFALAARALQSSVIRVESDVYAITADLLGGPVEYIFSGAILLHLRDPVLALQRLHDTLVPGGTITLLEPFSLRETLFSPRRAAATFRAAWSDFAWWLPNIEGLRAYLLAAGFERVGWGGLHHPAARPEMRQWLAAFTARRPR